MNNSSALCDFPSENPRQKKREKTTTGGSGKIILSAGWSMNFHCK
jgi:hypothetical protein